MKRRITSNVAKNGSNVNLPTLEEVDFEGSSSIDPGFSSSSLRQSTDAPSPPPSPPALKSYKQPLSDEAPPRSSGDRSNRSRLPSDSSSQSSGSGSRLVSRFSRLGSSSSRSTTSSSNYQRRPSLVQKLANSRLASTRVYRGYSIGHYALVLSKGNRLSWFDKNSQVEFPSSSDDLESNQSSDADICLLNKYGFPQGAGKYPFERKGPYVYVLCTIKQVHYEENEVFWTVVREDNGQEMRGDAGYMTPLHTKEGLQAAQKAAALSQSIANGTSSVVNEEQDGDRDRNPRGKKRTFCWCLGRCCCIGCCLPLFVVYHCFGFIYQCIGLIKETDAYKGLLRHAKNFLDGVYMISFRITSINVIVLFSIWYLFVDDIRLAILPPSADDKVAYVNLVVWLVLVLELVLEAFIRPEGWRDLVRSDKAYTPETARFISGIHLLVESIALLFFVPNFYCVFFDGDTCGNRTAYSFFEASLRVVMGPQPSHALVGRVFHGIQRWRIFGLVRHWRNAWIHNAFTKDKKQRKLEKKRRKELLREMNYVDDSTSTIDEENDSDSSLGEYDENMSAGYGLVPYGENEYSNELHRQQQRPASRKKKDNDNNEAMIKATNIGIALMTVTSHRALFLFCFLASCFPMLFLINSSSVVNPIGIEMVEYLQAINLQDADSYSGNDDSIDCNYLFESVEAWANTMSHRLDRRQLFKPNPLISNPLISVSIRPPRCYDSFNSSDASIGNLKFYVGENCPPWSWPETEYAGPCIYGTIENITEEDTTLRDVAHSLSLRTGSLQTFQSNPKTASLTFAVSATYNYEKVAREGALVSFFLELLLLAIVIFLLIQLRSDMVDLALGSLRSMLRIIARYASNPLAPPGRNEVYHRTGIAKSNASSDTGSAHGSLGEDDTEDDENQLIRNYETEQLVSAVTKITDLLRKCWGVAGANIISTNLASRGGDIEVFNPTVPGKNVFALFAFATITDFDHALKGLGGDVMILINDVASVLHNEVFRWGLGDSGQCNRNLGQSFVMVFKIGSVMEVVDRLEEATQVIFSTANGKKATNQKQKRIIDRRHPKVKSTTPLPSLVKGLRTDLHAEKDVAMEAMAEAMQLSLEQIPGISTFADRAVIGMLKSFAGINRDSQLRAWSRDFRLTGGSSPSSITSENKSERQNWSVNMIFGMDAGWAVEGAVGSKYKIDATYLSPHMNMAARMMSACKHYGVTILLSQAVRDLLSEAAKSKMRNLDRVTVKGSSKIQNIYTYDAHPKGADFFLYGVSDEQADQQAKNYEPNIWNKDPDLKAMRNHITEDFEQEFNAGMKAYYDGDWEQAIKKLEEANDIMVQAAIDEDDLHYELSKDPERKEIYRKEASDPPSMYLINFMKSKGGKAPEGWAGWHPLLSK